MQITFIIVGGLLLGIGVALMWFSKSSVKKPKVKGTKREYYTKGDMIIAKIRGKEL
jgi:hypothetical protein